MELEATTKIIKNLIEIKEFFIYPNKQINEFYDVVLHKQIWLTGYYIKFINGDTFLNSSQENQQSIMFNEYSVIKFKNKFKKINLYHIIIFKDEPTKETLNALKILVQWLNKQKLNTNISLVCLSTRKIIRIFENFIDQEEIINNINNTINNFDQDFEKIDLVESERKTRIEKGYYIINNKSVITKLIILINILVFTLMTLSGGSTEIYNLINFGAKYNPLIADGEYFRLVSNIFIHIGIAHLLFNSYAINMLGKDAESIYGPYKFIAIYLISGVFGSLGSFLFSDAVSAGASGAIFGLIGSYIYFGIRKPAIFSARYGMNLIALLIINIIFGLTNKSIDNFAHFGGLLGGLFASWVLGLRKENIFTLKRIIKIISIGIIISGLLFVGIQIHKNSWKYDLYNGIKSLQQEDFKSAKSEFLLGLGKNENISEFYFYLAYIYYFEGNTNLAIQYLNEALRINPEDLMAQRFLSQLTPISE